MAKRKMTSVYLTPDLQSRLDSMQIEFGTCKSTFINKILSEHFSRIDANKAAYVELLASRRD